eukprot:COSAG02_NODE_696_length_18385_cov_48.260855_17_plen_774_part_00
MAEQLQHQQLGEQPSSTEQRTPPETSANQVFIGKRDENTADKPEKQPYRFKVGDRVLALTKGSMDVFGTTASLWREGTIVQLDYWEKGWDEVAPYQILLDASCGVKDRHVAAPHDDDSCVRQMPKMAKDFPSDPRLGTECQCTQSGRSCPRHHCCDDGISCPDYHYCGTEGRRKTRMLKMLQQRKMAQSQSDVLCPRCDDTVQEQSRQKKEDIPLEELLAFIEGESNSNGSPRKSKPKIKTPKRDKRKRTGTPQDSQVKPDPQPEMQSTQTETSTNVLQVQTLEKSQDNQHANESANGASAGAISKNRAKTTQSLVREKVERKDAIKDVAVPDRTANLRDRTHGNDLKGKRVATTACESEPSPSDKPNRAESSSDDQPWETVTSRRCNRQTTETKAQRSKMTTSLRPHITATSVQTTETPPRQFIQRPDPAAQEAPTPRLSVDVDVNGTVSSETPDATLAAQTDIATTAMSNLCANEIEAEIAALEGRLVALRAQLALTARSTKAMQLSGLANVDVWLDRFELGRYSVPIKNLGYDHMIFVREASEKEVESLIEEVAMKPPHAKVFRRAFAELTGKSSSSSHCSQGDAVTRLSEPPPAIGASLPKSATTTQSAAWASVNAPAGVSSAATPVLFVGTSDENEHWPKLDDASWIAKGKCCASYEPHCQSSYQTKVRKTNGQAMSNLAWSHGCSMAHPFCVGNDKNIGNDCDCDCHAIAKAGRDVILAKLVEGMDFTPVFEPELFEPVDVDTEHTVQTFEKALGVARGQCAVTNAG